MTPIDDLSYCAQEVRHHDQDRYLTGIFAPVERREDLFALYAFNLEIAKTAESVSEALLGHMRLQWWRDSLVEIYERRPREHAVVKALSRAVRARDLDRELLEEVIEARAFDLDREPPETLAQLESYAKGTSASLVALSLQVLDAGTDKSSVFARHMGIAWAVTGLLRAIPHHAFQRRLYLPKDLCEAHAVDLRELFELRGTPGLSRLVADLVGYAEEHLTAARDHGRALPREAAPVRLLGVLAARYLKEFAGVGYDPFDSRLHRERPGKVWHLALAQMLKRY